MLQTFIASVWFGNGIPGDFDVDNIGMDNLDDTYAFVAFDDNSSGTDDAYGRRFDVYGNLDPIVRIDTDSTRSSASTPIRPAWATLNTPLKSRLVTVTLPPQFM